MKLKYFQCPHCGQPITPAEIPSDIVAAAFGSRKSPAKAEAARRNARLPRKKPVNPDDRTKPVPAAQVAEPLAIPAMREVTPALVVGEEPRYGGAADKPVAEPLKPLTLAEAKAKAEKLKPRVVGKVRDYSGVYS